MSEAICSNCHESVPSSSLNLHQVRCIRYNYFCIDCGQLVLKTEILEHKTGHQKKRCSECEAEVEETLVALHLQEECLFRLLKCNDCNALYRASDEHSCLVACEYCGESVAMVEMIKHLETCYDAVKTEQCDKCSKRIQLKFMIEHQLLHERGEIVEEAMSIVVETINCPTCNEQFDDYDFMVAHRMEKHDWEPQTYKCYKCKTHFMSVQDRELHIKYQGCGPVDNDTRDSDVDAEADLLSSSELD